MEEQLAGSDSEAAPVACAAGSLAACICPCSEGDNKASPLASAASGSLERPCILMSFSGLSDSTQPVREKREDIERSPEKFERTWCARVVF